MRTSGETSVLDASKKLMAKDVITVEGKDAVVREDTAKAYRFVNWGVTTAVICLAIMAILAFFLFFRSGTDKTGEIPDRRINSNSR